MQDRCEPLDWNRALLPGADLFDDAPVKGTTCTSTPRQRNHEPFQLRMDLKTLAFGESRFRSGQPGPWQTAFLMMDACLGRCSRFTGTVLRVCDADGAYYPFSLQDAL